MDRSQVYSEIRDIWGQVPEFFELLPDDVLALEWELMQQVQFEGDLPGKYRELVGLGIATAIHCRPCAILHTALARVFGATDAEIDEAIRYAEMAARHGEALDRVALDIDDATFRSEIARICEFVRAQQGQGLPASGLPDLEISGL
jgi:AhpD family alkylhydroperoxidase